LKENATYTSDVSDESSEKDKVVTRPAAVGCERVLNPW